MRFLVDECAGPMVAKWLVAQGHEIFSVYDLARGMKDDSIIQKAFDENWILLTADKDFGEQVFRERKPHHGIILLRLENERAKIKIDVLRKLLASYAALLPEQFVVVTEKKVRISKR